MGFKKGVIWKDIDRYTYIKGSFTGKYRGHLDSSKLGSNHEKYYDIEVYEGEIYDFETEKNNPLEVNEDKYILFKSELNFLQERFENIVSKPLYRYDQEFDFFKLKINGPKVKNIQISEIVKEGNRTFGTITCIVFGYISDVISKESVEVEICEDCNNPAPDCNCDLLSHSDELEQLYKPDKFPLLKLEITKDYSVNSSGCLQSIKAIGFVLLFCLGLTYYPILSTIFLLFLILIFGVDVYHKFKHKKWFLFNLDWIALYRYVYSKALKIIVVFVLLIAAIVYYSYSQYKEKEAKRIERERIYLNKEQLRLKQESFKRNQDSLLFIAKKDSSAYYLIQADRDLELNRYSKAILNLDKSIAIFPNNYEAEFRKAVSLKKLGKYNEAIKSFDNLSSKTDEYKSEVYLEKGRCFFKLQNREKAVLQIYKSAQLKNVEAGKLYEKVNPIIKELVGYVTRCCDGTASTAKGRGACSHHGGVCNWNEPVYRKRRKYPIGN